MEPSSKAAELASLRERIDQLEAEILSAGPAHVWTPPPYYAAYELMSGMVLGLIAAGASLLFNIVGALMVGKHPLELIRVYLTFPLGESALALEQGFALAAGICLYLGTGMFGGIPIHMILGRFFKQATMPTRFAVATVLGLGVWIVNYYALISWVQPWLIGGNWILERIPMPVAIATHLVFAWTMLLTHRWGQFVPYKASVAAAGARPAR